MPVRQALVEDALGIATVNVRSWQVAYRGLVPQDFLDGLDPAQSRLRWERTLSSQNGRDTKETVGDFLPSTVLDWYSTHHLFLLAAGSSRPAEVPATQGAAAPTWSADGKNILYVAGNYLWLLRRTGSRPVKVAGPILVPSVWGAFFGEVNWQSDFAWSEA